MMSGTAWRVEWLASATKRLSYILTVMEANDEFFLWREEQTWLWLITASFDGEEGASVIMQANDHE